ncbi:hypothetical protein D9756_000157 [Leucocoprinus leucothites]|uniref:Uncharacterized protein n=1 Tax=Leucocoprinus leucothites TaxID=201217 RepID=A0A8H5GET4_9AGAR|nr:hypothetical protein D9756_000157 [Leucoagaricus leucothites]
MVSPAPSISKSQHTNLRICSTCEGPMRGHSRVDRKYVCPPREKLLETLEQLWDEGHRDFVASIAKKHNTPFPPHQFPLTTPTAAASLADRLRQRKPTPFQLSDELDELKPKIEGSVSSVTSNIRRMINKVIDERKEPNSPSRSSSLSSDDTTIPDTSSEGLPAVGPWNAQRLQDWRNPQEPEELMQSERGSLVPTLLVGSDGQTIREGSRAEAHFRAQAQLEAKLRRQQETPYVHSPPPSESYEGISVIRPSSSEINHRDYDGSGFHRVLRSVAASPAIMAIPVRPEDVARVRETAARQGLHTSVLEVVPRTPRGTSRALPQVFRNALVKRSASMDTVTSVDSAEDDRPIVVIGSDLAMTRRYVEMAQRGVMPGRVVTDHLTEPPRLVTVPQLILVSVLTAIVMFSLFAFFVR